MAKTGEPRKKHIGAGHRKRLRTRFLQSGFDGYLDYEIVELLLTLGTPMKDCKQMAKAVIKEFGGLRGALEASLDELQKTKGIGPANAFGLKLFQAVSERLAKEQIPKKIALNSAKAVAGYLQKYIGLKKKECFIVLYLNARNQLVHQEIISIGTLNASLVHPREVFEPAVKNLAAQIIVAHNHPSGGVEPSNGDMEVTMRLISAGKLLGIELIDHLIVAGKDFYSFKENKLI